MFLVNLKFTTPLFTSGNVQAFLRKMFPSEEDTQAGINILEKAKSWPGWGNLQTVSQVRRLQNGKLQIHRVTIAMPLARWLLSEYGDFLLVDCTFKLTIYVGRYHIFISVIDGYGHVHPVVVSEVPGMFVRGSTGFRGGL